MPGNPMCHFEFMVNDIDKAQAFYRQLFDWEFEMWQGPMPYAMIKTGKEPGGGMMKKPDEAPHNALNMYVLVDDIDATLGKVEQAGGQVIVPKMEIPEMGWHAMFMDPDGIPVGVFQEK